MEYTPPGGVPSRAWSRRMRLATWIGAAATVAAVLTPTAAQAAGPGSAHQTPGATGQQGAPVGFAPASTSWTTPARGWVLGFAPCPDGSCPALLRTTDSGRSWRQRRAPAVANTVFTVDAVKVRFANRRDGFATDGQRLTATHNGAATWHGVLLPGAVGSVFISALATSDRYAYAVVSHGLATRSVTQLYASPLHRDDWEPVPGVGVIGMGGWDIATHGSAAYVSLGVVFESARFWSTEDGRTWTERQPLCGVDAAVRLSSSRAKDVRALCSLDPHRGQMIKTVVESANGTDPLLLGQAPDDGISTAFATTPSGSAFVGAVGNGASWVHASFDNGATWQTPLRVDTTQFPMLDLAFTDDAHGVVLWGGPRWPRAVIFRTTDGGHTWQPLTF